MDAVRVGVVGFSWGCWKCSESVQCVVGPYRYGDNEIPLGDPAQTLAREILLQDGKTEVAALLVRKHHRDGSEGELASHCGSCGAVQGNFYVQNEALSRLIDADGHIETLDLIADGECDEAAWKDASPEYGDGVGMIYF
ncbi:hypothetical protein [Nocardia sp. NPDC050718]|uniref:hypothetical protein n=1 Tax=Nocardia sp. NPDC050718 TaxID=3155788 RepID=UPI0034042329